MCDETDLYRGCCVCGLGGTCGLVSTRGRAAEESRAFLADKRLRALALDADVRWSELPDVPVLAEIGYGKEKVANWFGVAGPPGMPPAMVQRLREEFVKASRDPELQRRLAENGTLIATSTSEEMRAMMVDEVATMETLVKTLGIRSQ